MNKMDFTYNQILDFILAVLNNKSLILEIDSNIKDSVIEKFKKGNKIHIKEKNRGKFTESAKKEGQTVLLHAKSVLSNPSATKLLKKRAQFAINSKKWNHE